VDAPVDVVVIGAGIAGLTTADELHRAGVAVRVIEARPRLGGRTLTVHPDGMTGAFDLGATWIWSDQPAVLAMANRLGIETFAQHEQGRHLAEEVVGMPPAAVVVAPSPAKALRLAGGTQQICDLLAAELPPGAIALSTRAVAIEVAGTELTVTTDNQGVRSRIDTGAVVVALPPRLMMEKISFTPPIPAEFERVLKLTPTWMGGAIKCVAVYDAPFWRAAGLSGTAFSTVGPLREIHDGSPVDGATGALWGLFSGEDQYREMGPGERADLAFAQFERLFGNQAADPVQYFERDWSSDPNTNDEVFWVDEPLLDYGHPLFSEPVYESRLIWAGAETVADGGGHLEGAVRSGQRAAALARAVATQSSM
jgi:monoamine oxidase